MKDPTVKFSGTITPGQEKFARVISILTHPPLIAIPTFPLAVSDIPVTGSFDS